MNRLTLPLAASLALVAAPAAVPAYAADTAIVSTCKFLPDPRGFGSADIEYYRVVGGPVFVQNMAVTSVTVTCHILADGWVADTVSETRPGNVGYATGRAVVGTFSGPQVQFCTVVSWTGGTGGGYNDCPNAS